MDFVVFSLHLLLVVVGVLLLPSLVGHVTFGLRILRVNLQRGRVELNLRLLVGLPIWILASILCTNAYSPRPVCMPPPPLPLPLPPQPQLQFAVGILSGSFGASISPAVPAQGGCCRHSLPMLRIRRRLRLRRRSGRVSNVETGASFKSAIAVIQRSAPVGERRGGHI